MRRLARSLSSTLACLIAVGALLVTPLVAAPAVPRGVAMLNLAMPVAEEQEEGCTQGKRTKAFGWMLVDYGIATMKYVVGLFLIPVGLLLVCVGIVVEVAEAATCG